MDNLNRLCEKHPMASFMVAFSVLYLIWKSPPCVAIRSITWEALQPAELPVREYMCDMMDQAIAWAYSFQEPWSKLILLGYVLLMMAASYIPLFLVIRRRRRLWRNGRKNRSRNL